METDIQSLGDVIAGLTSAQAKSLGEYLENVHGIVANNPVDLSNATHAPTGIPVTIIIEEKKEYFSVILTGLASPDKKLSTIKAVRTATGLGLNESKTFVEAVMAGTSKPVKEGLAVPDAEALKKVLEDAGGKVELD